jgi:SM-20-related protein
MNSAVDYTLLQQPPDDYSPLFSAIANDLYAQGYSIQVAQLPTEVLIPVANHCMHMHDTNFAPAGIGRTLSFQQNRFVRRDEICWINGDTEAGKIWLNWAGQLQRFLNQHLLLGLFSFESHFAHYPPNAFYKRHMDAFKGEANRVLSMVVYLNSDWPEDGGGELVLYRDEQDIEGVKVTPLMGTIVTFLSEDFPHEVLPARLDRYSIAGWYRLNTSRADRVDPAR